jgi:hypothetical protein
MLLLRRSRAPILLACGATCRQQCTRQRWHTLRGLSTGSLEPLAALEPPFWQDSDPLEESLLDDEVAVPFEERSLIQEANPFRRGPEHVRDVFDRPVVLHYPRLAESTATANGSSYTYTWQDVLAAGAPTWLPENEARQWRQEVIELYSVDEAVRAYRERYAQVETRHRLSSGEILERRLSQRELISAGWFQKLSERLRQDMRDWLSSDIQVVTTLKQRLGFPFALNRIGLLVNQSVSCPIEAALETLQLPMSTLFGDS